MVTVLYPSPGGPVWIYPNTPDPYVGAVVFATFLYGAYLIIFIYCMVVLGRRNCTPWVTRLFVSVMFAFASADMGYTLYLLFRRVLQEGVLTFEDLRPKYILYVVNSTFADALLLYRCYIVWNQNVHVIIGPALLLVIVCVCGFAFEGTTLPLAHYSWINLSLSIALNVIITTIAAGRLWYLSQTTRTILGNEVSRQYRVTLILVIESGVIYTLYTLLDLIFWHNASVNIILDAGLNQVVGIISTKIIAQLSLERVSRSDQPMALSTLRATPSTPPPITSTQTSSGITASDNTVRAASSRLSSIV